MPTVTQLAAQNAIATHGLDGNRNIHAVKATREATGCGLREAVEAVAWAIENQAGSRAAGLPEKSIVATVDSIYTRVVLDEPTMPWVELTDGKHLNYASDDDVDDLLQSGEATVLRVGTGTP